MLAARPQYEETILAVPGTALTLPAFHFRGEAGGPRLLLTAGVHSREYIGMEALLRLAADLRQMPLWGEVLILPLMNYNGLIQRSPDIFPEDGLNLNRVFPGSATGSETKRLAYYLQSQVLPQVDYLVDFHSGGYAEALTPHLYFHGAAAPAFCDASERLARWSAVPYRVRSLARNGFYSYGGQMGVPGILIERGGQGLRDTALSEGHYQDALNILRGLQMLRDGLEVTLAQQERFDQGHYLDAPTSGLWYPFKKVGENVTAGEPLGEIRSAFGAVLHRELAACNGVLLYQTATLGIEAGTPLVAYAERASSVVEA